MIFQRLTILTNSSAEREGAAAAKMARWYTLTSDSI